MERLVFKYNLPRHSFRKYLQLQHLLVNVKGEKNPTSTVRSPLQTTRIMGLCQEASIYHVMISICTFCIYVYTKVNLGCRFDQKICENVTRVLRDIEIRFIQFRTTG